MGLARKMARARTRSLSRDVRTNIKMLWADIAKQKRLDLRGDLTEAELEQARQAALDVYRLPTDKD